METRSGLKYKCKEAEGVSLSCEEQQKQQSQSNSVDTASDTELPSLESFLRSGKVRKASDNLDQKIIIDTPVQSGNCSISSQDSSYPMKHKIPKEDEPMEKKQCRLAEPESACESECNTVGDVLSPSDSDCESESGVQQQEKPPGYSDWMNQFMAWSPSQRRNALDILLNSVDASLVRHVMTVVEPMLQRDFISLLPKELSLHLLSFLEPKDLCNAALTCRYWRILAEDQLLWREKCREEHIDLHGVFPDERASSRPRRHSGRPVGSGEQELYARCPWKAAFLRQQSIEHNWRTASPKHIKTLKGHDDHVITCLEYSEGRIVSGSDDNTLKVWSAISGRVLRTLQGHTGGVWSSQMCGNTVISGSTDRTLRVWNAETGQCVHTLYGHSSTVRCLHLHNEVVVSGSRDATLRMWDVVSGECLHHLVGHVAAVRCVAYDGKRVVSGAYDYMVKVWDPRTESCLHTLSGHTNRVYSLQFDGIHVVSGSLDTSIRVWDAASGECKHVLTGHQSLTSGMELQDNILVSGNADSTVRVWDINTGRCLHTLTGSHKHESAVTCLQFNRKFVITSSDDGTVKIWDLSTGDFLGNLLELESGGSGGVVWRIRASNTRLVCAVGSRNGTEDTKLIVLDFDEIDTSPLRTSSRIPVTLRSRRGASSDN